MPLRCLRLCYTRLVGSTLGMVALIVLLQLFVLRDANRQIQRTWEKYDSDIIPTLPHVEQPSHHSNNDDDDNNNNNNDYYHNNSPTASFSWSSSSSSSSLRASFQAPETSHPYTTTDRRGSLWIVSATTGITPREYIFPRWPNTQEGGEIRMETLLSFWEGVLQNTTSTSTWKTNRERFPETPYIMDHGGVWVSDTIRSRNWKIQWTYRLEPTEALLRLAFETLSKRHNWSTNHNDRNVTQDDSPQLKWPHLYGAVMTGNGVPFTVWYGDSEGCSKHNVVWYQPPVAAAAAATTVVVDDGTAVGTNGARLSHDASRHRQRKFTNPFQNVSIPLLTTCGRIDCDYALPIPTYKTILDAQATAGDWDRIWSNQVALDQTVADATTKEKIPRIVWRGSLSNPLARDGSDVHEAPRWRLAKLAHEHEREHCTESNSTHPRSKQRCLLDVGLVSIPERHKNIPLDLHQVGGLKDPIRPMQAFENYMGILDIDGNTWSSRFGTLLCYDAVVLKVDPKYVDLFMRELVPGKHYIPIRSDLSDLLEKAQFVTDPRNKPMIQSIIANAHEWCQTHNTWSALAEDVLDVLELYVHRLDQTDPNWNQGTWGPYKKEVMDTTTSRSQGLPSFAMRLIQDDVAHTTRQRKRPRRRHKKKKPETTPTRTRNRKESLSAALNEIMHRYTSP